MKYAIDETNRRRAKQLAYNEEHHITPASIKKAIDASLVEMYSPEWAVVPEIDGDSKASKEDDFPAHELPDRITELRRQMMDAADALEYERAAELRDRIKKLERKVFGEAMGIERPAQPPAPPPGSAGSSASRAARNRMEKDTVEDVSIHGMRTRGMRKTKPQAPPAKQGRLKLIPDAPK
jgi:excinuclease ABC subunit B